MKILVILNDPPYGSERSWNGLRLAGALARSSDIELRVFLFGDAVGCALAGQRVPDGYYHLDRIIGSILRHNGEVSACGTCLDARAFMETALVAGVRRSNLEEVAEWTIWADKIINF